MIEFVAGDIIGGNKTTVYHGQSNEEAERRHHELLDAIARKNGVEPETLRPIFDHLGLRGLSTDDLRRRAEEAIAALLEQARKKPERTAGNEDITAAILAAREKLKVLDSTSAISELQKKIGEEEAARRTRIVPLLREKADIELKTYDYRAARQTLEKLTSSTPDDAQAWLDLGDACLAVYEPQAASNAYDHARISARGEADSRPSDSQAWRSLARVHVKLGTALMYHDIWKGEDIFQEGLQIIKPLSVADDADVETLSILADLHEGIGTIWASFGDWDTAQKFFREESRAIDRLIAFAPNDPKWQRALARVTQRISDGFVATAKMALFYELALSGFERVVDIFERLLQTHADNGSDQDALAWGHRRVGDALSELGDYKRALTSYRAGIAVAEQLDQKTREVVEWQNNLSKLYTKQGAVLETTGDLDGAISSYRKALAVSERLLPLWPRNPNFLRDVVNVHEGAGDVLEKLEDYTGAAEAYQAGATLAENYLSVDVGMEQAIWMDELQRMHNKLGKALVSKGDKNSGLVALRRSLEVSERIITTWPHAVTFLKNVILANLALATANDDAARRWQAIIESGINAGCECTHG